MYIIHRAAHFLVGYDWAVMAFVFLGGWIFLRQMRCAIPIGRKTKVCGGAPAVPWRSRG